MHKVVHNNDFVKITKCVPNLNIFVIMCYKK